MARFRQRIQALKTDMHALYLASRHAGTPWHAKWLVIGLVAYAFSPIDLIPDFIPVLGLVDDMILLPLGVALAIRMIPPGVLSECRARSAQAIPERRPVSRAAGAAIVAIWVVVLALVVVWGYGALAG